MECINGDDSVEKVELFTNIADQLVVGGGFSRTAYFCGEEYVVEQFYDPLGVYWVGPFTL